MQRLSGLDFQGTLLFHLYPPLGNEFLAAFAIDEPKKTFWCVVVRLHAIFSLLGSRRGLFIETIVRNLSCHGAYSSAALDAFRDLCRADHFIGRAGVILFFYKQEYRIDRHANFPPG